MADQATVRRWLTQLGRLNGVRIEPEEASEYLDAFCPMLARRFDDGAFTAESLDHVTGECKYLPTYGEVVQLLSAWLRQHRETERLLALPPPAQEAREPYKPPPAPEWCFERESRLMGRHSREEIAALAQKPVRSVKEQLEQLHRMMAEEAGLAMAAE